MIKRICDYCGENQPKHNIRLSRRPNDTETIADLCDICLGDIVQSAIWSSEDHAIAWCLGTIKRQSEVDATTGIAKRLFDDIQQNIKDMYEAETNNKWDINLDEHNTLQWRQTFKQEGSK